MTTETAEAPTTSLALPRQSPDLKCVICTDVPDEAAKGPAQTATIYVQAIPKDGPTKSPLVNVLACAAHQEAAKKMCREIAGDDSEAEIVVRDLLPSLSE
ncbi:MAG: hypothetical protein WC675_00095 [Patescibacteria group bacterium]|jgi:hypothetical protein